MNNNSSPYHAPDSDIIDNTNNMAYQPVDIFNASQRIGRVRYLAYNFVSIFVIFVTIGIVSAIMLPTFSMNNSLEQSIAVTIFSLIFVYVVPFIINIIIARRRLHDLNQSGWMALLLIVPLVNIAFALYLIFAPGTQGQNNYGLRPEPNTVLTWLGGLIGPILMIGILAAISIPAYLEYQERASAYSESD